jgi:peptidyl-prolyl cis-trans isomerase C
MVKWKASHILVEKQSTALELLEKIKNGKKFEDMAKQWSQCPSGKRGGSLGWFAPGQMVKEFEQALKDMKQGEIAGPVRTQFGYHLIRLDDRKG